METDNLNQLLITSEVGGEIKSKIFDLSNLRSYANQHLNLRENIAITLRSINQSKGKKDPETWIADAPTILSHGIDLNLAKSAIHQAKTGIDQAAAGLKK